MFFFLLLLSTLSLLLAPSTEEPYHYSIIFLEHVTTPTRQWKERDGGSLHSVKSLFMAWIHFFPLYLCRSWRRGEFYDSRCFFFSSKTFSFLFVDAVLRTQINASSDLSNINILQNFRRFYEGRWSVSKASFIPPQVSLRMLISACFNQSCRRVVCVNFWLHTLHAMTENKPIDDQNWLKHKVNDSVKRSRKEKENQQQKSQK